jgi:putative salt-induced outer membrane protein YdiY
LRQTSFVGPKPFFVPGIKQNVIAGRIASNFMYKMSDTLVFTNATGALINKGSDSLYSRSLLSASLTEHINAGIGFDVTHETADASILKPKQTDTTTRFTLGYKF